METGKLISLADLFGRIEASDFDILIPDEETAYSTMAAEKWKEGFVCRHCANTNFCRGKTLHSRRCTRCKREESVTAHTVFHKCKIGLRDALRIAYMVCHTPSISTYEIGRKLDIRQMTCWKFKKKIQECMNEHQQMERKEIDLNNPKTISELKISSQ